LIVIIIVLRDTRTIRRILIIIIIIVEHLNSFLRDTRTTKSISHYREGIRKRKINNNEEIVRKLKVSL